MSEIDKRLSVIEERIKIISGEQEHLKKLFFYGNGKKPITEQITSLQNSVNNLLKAQTLNRLIIALIFISGLLIGSASSAILVLYLLLKKP